MKFVVANWQINFYLFGGSHDISIRKWGKEWQSNEGQSYKVSKFLLQTIMKIGLISKKKNNIPAFISFISRVEIESKRHSWRETFTQFLSFSVSLKCHLITSLKELWFSCGSFPSVFKSRIIQTQKFKVLLSFESLQSTVYSDSCFESLKKWKWKNSKSFRYVLITFKKCLFLQFIPSYSHTSAYYLFHTYLSLFLPHRVYIYVQFRDERRILCHVCTKLSKDKSKDGKSLTSHISKIQIFIALWRQKTSITTCTQRKFADVFVKMKYDLKFLMYLLRKNIKFHILLIKW